VVFGTAFSLVFRIDLLRFWWRNLRVFFDKVVNDLRILWICLLRRGIVQNFLCIEGALNMKDVLYVLLMKLTLRLSLRRRIGLEDCGVLLPGFCQPPQESIRKAVIIVIGDFTGILL